MDTREKLSQIWPLFALRIRTPLIEMRLPTDEDLLELVEIARGGVHDPDFMPFSVAWTALPSPELEQGMLRHYWLQRTKDRPEDLSIAFVVVTSKGIVGMQDISAKDRQSKDGRHGLVDRAEISRERVRD